MKPILALVLFSNLLFANYSIYFQGIKLGEVENFDSLERGCLEATVTNSIARFLLGKDKFVFYNDNYKGSTKQKDTKYKRDKYHIITILKKAANNTIKNERIPISEGKFIDVKLEDKYKFTYNSKGKIKSDGYFTMKNNELKEFVEEVNSIEIIKN